GKRTARWSWVVWLLLPTLFLVGCGRRGGGNDRGGGLEIPGIGIEITSGGSSSGGGGSGGDTSGGGSGGGDASGGTVGGSGGDPGDATRAPAAERTDPAQEAFRAVDTGSCLPVHRNGEEWSADVPPSSVSCHTERADLFYVTAVHPTSTSCPTGVGRTAWSHRSSVTGETTTLCLNRVWVKNYCVLAQQEGDAITSIGDTSAVDCDATQVPVPYNQVLVVDAAYKAPAGADADNCVTGANDRRRYWSLIADGGDTLVCFRGRS
ncbi:hypothetical protein, partial [Streptomyces sp. UH6]|uniref:hypothetical protein n=1 Tax=Streptomyces sp. UH6 TaxID=2748379 RepID=UPI0027D21FAB